MSRDPGPWTPEGFLLGCLVVGALIAAIDFFVRGGLNHAG